MAKRGQDREDMVQEVVLEPDPLGFREIVLTDEGDLLAQIIRRAIPASAPADRP